MARPGQPFRLWIRLSYIRYGARAPDVSSGPPESGAGGRRDGWPLSLSPQEREVLRLLAEFRTNNEIAEALVISPRTAEKHVEHIIQKLGVVDRREAARKAGEVLKDT